MNSEIAKILSEIGEYLAMQRVQFKPRAYEKAAQAIAGLEEDVRGIYRRDGLKGLMKIPGVGESIARKIEEFVKTGRIRAYTKLKKDAPVDLAALTAVAGLGPQKIQRLYAALGIKNLKDLEGAARQGKIAPLPGFGSKTEENILRDLAFAKTSGQRFVTGFILPQIQSVLDKLTKLPQAEKLTVAGSYRRRRETVGDIDILLVSAEPQAVMDHFVKLPEVRQVIAHGPTKSSVKLRSGPNVDLRIVPAKSYGAALLYFTGSKAHNVVLRQLAIKKGYKLNEYGLFRLSSSGKEQSVAGETEEEIYRTLGLPFIPPEIRENVGEIELARENRLPDLLPYGSLKGDLQVQTNWSDGKESIEAMVRAATARGLQYIAVTDHTQRLAMAHGLNEKRLRRQASEIDRVNRKLAGHARVLKGTECDILKDGSLDLPDRALAELDVVGASIHSYFNLSRREQTSRLVRAMRNPHVDVIFHPTNRILNRRPAVELDMDEVIRAARATGTVLEIDAYPDRSDLADESIRRCVENGVKLAVDSDAHASAHFSFLEHGVAQARRGFAGKRDVVNAWPLAQMKKKLKA